MAVRNRFSVGGSRVRFRTFSSRGSGTPIGTAPSINKTVITFPQQPKHRLPLPLPDLLSCEVLRGLSVLFKLLEMVFHYNIQARHLKVTVLIVSPSPLTEGPPSRF